MRVFVVICLLFATNGATAQAVVTDAFGIYFETNTVNERSNWSDVSPNIQNSALILPFVGPKSLTAGKDRGHAIALVFDQFGNLAMNGEAFAFKIGSSTQTSTIQNGIAEVHFAPGVTAGAFEVGISNGDIQSTRSTYRVTADIAVVKPAVIAQTQDAKLETFVEFKIEPLLDQFGNSAPSGFGAQLVLTHSDGSFSLMSPYVQNSALAADFLVRDIPDGGLLQASFGGQKSTHIQVNVAPMALAQSTHISARAMPSIRAIEIVAGPVLTASGHVLNDGAEARLTVGSGSGRSVTQTGWLRDGYFKTVMAIEPTDLPMIVDLATALGNEQIVIKSLSASNETNSGFGQ